MGLGVAARYRSSARDMKVPVPGKWQYKKIQGNRVRRYTEGTVVPKQLHSALRPVTIGILIRQFSKTGVLLFDTGFFMTRVIVGTYALFPDYIHK